MTAVTTQDLSAQDLSARPSSLHNMIWRWHFYAGLFCIPFVIWLATTGSIFLFKPQIEAIIDRPYDRLTATAVRSSAASQVRAALKSIPGSVLASYELPPTPHSAVRVIVARGGQDIRVYVDPYSLKILKTVPENDRLMNVIFRLHGQLLLGNRGSMIVELAASWAIVMIVTGLYLWWPRQTGGLAGVVYPRLRHGGRVFWRDLHAVTGVWVSTFALLLLLSGLPWASNWGGYLKDIRKFTGTDVAKQDWPTGAPASAASGMSGMPGMAMSGMAMSGMEMPGMKMPGIAGSDMAGQPPTYDIIDRMIATVAPLGLADPVLISPPRAAGSDWRGDNGAGNNWTARSDTQNRPLRTDLVLDAQSGAIVSRINFSQHHLIDRIVGTGVAAHEGHLFGWANQLLSLLTACGLIMLSVSALMLWWRRRPSGVLGAPHRIGRRSYPVGLIAAMVGFGLFLPMLGASMIAVGLTERLLLRRIPAVSRWLGLRGAYAD